MAFELSSQADIFTPIGQNTSPTMQNREMHPGIRVIGRLRPEVTLTQAQAELVMIGRRLAEQYPKANGERTIGAETLRQEIVGDVRPTLWLLLAAVSLVVLIACVNVASLLLARYFEGTGTGHAHSTRREPWPSRPAVFDRKRDARRHVRVRSESREYPFGNGDSDFFASK